jgi:AraC-like DNA-binding protein
MIPSYLANEVPVVPSRAAFPIDPDKSRQPAWVFVRKATAGGSPWHSHRRAQLAHVSEGVMTVQTEHGSWVIPPERGVWIIPGISHRVSTSRPHIVSALYVEPSLVKLPSRCCVIAVDPLVRELLLAAGAFGHTYEQGTPEARVIRVILDRLPTLPVTSLNLPEPSDERLRQISNALRENPADSRSLANLSRAFGMSDRTAERLFQRELGSTFREWRRQIRLSIALERLGAGDSVTNVAMDVGYEDVSAFIAMFKTALGQTPGQYFRSGALVVETSRQATHTRRKSETVTRIRRTA